VSGVRGSGAVVGATVVVARPVVLAARRRRRVDVVCRGVAS
jgi:hypothetical protein